MQRQVTRMTFLLNVVPLVGLVNIAFATETDCYKLSDGKCGVPLTQGECLTNQWLLEREGVLKCVDRDCNEDNVLLEGECKNILDLSLCAGNGEAVFLNSRGEPTCQCLEGWGRQKMVDNEITAVWKGTTEASVQSQGDCYQEFTRGFCPSK